jgi:hypothetical protein
MLKIKLSTRSPDLCFILVIFADPEDFFSGFNLSKRTGTAPLSPDPTHANLRRKVDTGIFKNTIV